MTKNTKSVSAFLVPWVLNVGLWLGISLWEHLNSFVEDERGQLVLAGFSWAQWLSILQWYVPAVPCTVLLWSLSRRLVHWPRFWPTFAALVLGTALVNVFWMGLLDGIVGNFGLGWMAVWVPRYAAILGCFVAYRHMRLAEERKRELLAAQLRVLRAQLQPHFLFNTLHTIGVACKQDGATAARMTTLLGDLLRQTLRERSGALVSLAEEHELLQPYLQLQQLRFADRLRVDIDLPPNVLAGAVPDLLLQPLVENALQHGIEQRPGSGHVRVVGRRVGDHLLIDVHDDGVGVAAKGGEPVLGTGLGATKARLAALYGDDASLSLRANDHGGTTASLILPWREVAHAA